MAKVLSVVGNRPQLIKMAPLSQLFIKMKIKESILHSGQHYDYNLNGQFFEELSIPEPYKVLKLGSNLTHATMTAEILVKVEAEILELKPDFVLVYGDTNTTLAAALAAVKLRIPVVHVEAGPRIHDPFNPEEINRKTVDHCSSVLLCPDEISMLNLGREGLTDKSFVVGDLMYDLFLQTTENIGSVNCDGSIFVTIHRPENTDSADKLAEIVNLLASLGRRINFAVHPRTEARMKSFGLWEKIQSIQNITVLPPLGYRETVHYICQSAGVVTDSGGLQKEAYWARKPAVFYFHTSPWPALKNSGWQLVAADEKYDRSKIADFINHFKPDLPHDDYFGGGDSAKKILAVLGQLGFV